MESRNCGECRPGHISELRHIYSSSRQLHACLNGSWTAEVSLPLRQPCRLSLNGAFAWLHEKYVTNYQGSTALSIPVIESLMKSNIDGQLLNGGIVNATAVRIIRILSASRYRSNSRSQSGPAVQTQISPFPFPDSRSHSHERGCSYCSDASTGKKIIDGTNTSGFGLGWSQPFSQRLDIITMTPGNGLYGQKEEMVWLHLHSTGSEQYRSTREKRR